MRTASSTSTWEDLHVRSARDLYASVPAFAKCGTHPAIAALTVAMTFARTAITARRSENSVAARVVISPRPDADPAVLRLVRHMEAAVTGSACHARNTKPFDPGTWLEQSGYIDLLARAIKAGANESELKDMALPPCHAFFQFYVADGKLSCQLYQRSADTFLGVPFNIASYALLTRMVAQQLDLEPGEFIWTGGDVHVYDNHVDQVAEQLSREPYDYPQLKILRKPDSIFDYTLEDFEVVDYRHHPTIKAPIAV